MGNYKPGHFEFRIMRGICRVRRTAKNGTRIPGKREPFRIVAERRNGLGKTDGRSGWPPMLQLDRYVRFLRNGRRDSMTFGADPEGESPAEIGACPSTVSWLPISSENWFLFSSELVLARFSAWVAPVHLRRAVPPLYRFSGNGCCSFPVKHGRNTWGVFSPFRQRTPHLETLYHPE